MRRDDVRLAAAARDDGIRRISRFTWRAGAAGVACSALIAVAFGHHAAQPPKADRGSSGSGTIVVPNQPPAPAKGASQVTSGGS